VGEGAGCSCAAACASVGACERLFSVSHWCGRGVAVCILVADCICHTRNQSKSIQAGSQVHPRAIHAHINTCIHPYRRNSDKLSRETHSRTHLRTCWLARAVSAGGGDIIFPDNSLMGAEHAFAAAPLPKRKASPPSKPTLPGQQAQRQHDEEEGPEAARGDCSIVSGAATAAGEGAVAAVYKQASQAPETGVGAASQDASSSGSGPGGSAPPRGIPPQAAPSSAAPLAKAAVAAPSPALPPAPSLHFQASVTSVPARRPTAAPGPLPITGSAAAHDVPSAGGAAGGGSPAKKAPSARELLEKMNKAGRALGRGVQAAQDAYAARKGANGTGNGVQG
jgi:hypothetical protein